MHEEILQAMRNEIAKHGLELLQRHPDDLNKFDAAVIERAALPGAKIAWMVGHCHTHLAVLGIHPEENLKVTYHLNLSSEDRFYLLTVGETKFKLTELSREAYGKLHTTPVPYSKIGTSESFTLIRNSRSVGHVQMSYQWKSNREQGLAVLTPDHSATLTDRYALETWAAETAIKRITGFNPCFVEWVEPVQLRQAA